MNRRRLTGLIGLIILVGVVAALTYYDSRRPKPETPIAFAPAQSADESVPVDDAPIKPPALLTEALPPDQPQPETEVAAAPPVTDVAPPIETEAIDTATDEPPMEEPAPAVAAAQPSAEPARKPAPDVAATATPAKKQTVGSPAGSEPTREVATAETPTETPALAIPAIVPTFDVVRVEPSGEMVVAGLAEPEATVEVLDGPTAIATAEANERGEWALSLDQPLSPGTHDLAIRTTSKSRGIAILSDQRVAVSVPDDKSSDVLVVLNAPDVPSRVLQLPPAKQPAVAEPQVAMAEPAPPVEEAPAVAEPEVAMAEPAPPVEETPAVAGPQVAMAEPAPPVEEAPAVAEPEVAMAEPAPPVEETPAVAGPQVAMAEPTPPVEDAPAVAGPEVAMATSGEPEPAPPASVETAVVTGAATEPPIDARPPKESAPPVAAGEPPPTEPVIEPVVTVAAVEADTAGGLYVAGTAETSEPVRIYLDGDPIGEATPSPSGTWLVETRREIPPGTYQVRADQVDRTTGAVIARAEVPFERAIRVATLEPTATTGAADGAEVSGTVPRLETVIIKRGDNLWRIARRVYGRGIRYSTIYQANRDQIRNPRWIYPGQVFVLPAGDLSWQN